MASLAGKNLFERLSDDLLRNILDRLLWRPLDLSKGKAQERLQLELVCKRFQALVLTSGSLEWDFMSGSHSEEVFIRYVLARSQCLQRLQRIALYALGDASLMTFLLLLIPHASRTLLEVRVFVQGDVCVNWGGLFRLLQSCSELSVLDINLWDSCPEGSSSAPVLLKFDTPLKPFKSLKSLSLYGLAVPSASFQSFIQAFPSLTALELHLDEGGSCYALPNVFWWGANTEDLDVAGPRQCVVPRSLQLLLSIIRSGHTELKYDALEKLRYLFTIGVANQKVFVDTPGCVQGLADSLAPEQDRECALLVLEQLACEPEARRILGRVSANIENLVKFLVDTNAYGYNEELQQRIVGVLSSVLCCEMESRKVLESLPDSVRGLVAYVVSKLHADPDTGASIARQVLHILASLTGNVGRNARTSLQPVLDQLCASRVPGLFEGLVDLLDDGDARVRRAAGEELARLVDGYDNVEAVGALPNCLTKVVSNLSHPSWNLQISSAQTLQSLSADNETARAIAKEPKSLVRLRNLLLGRSTSVQEAGAWALYNLTFDPEDRAEIGRIKLPDIVPRLVEILTEECPEGVQEAVAALLGQMSLDADSKKVIVDAPGSLPMLNSLLECHSVVVREHAAWVLYGLAEDSELRKVVYTWPGVLKRLGCLLARGSPEGVKEAAAAALGNLALDPDGARMVARETGCVSGLLGGVDTSAAGTLKEVMNALRNISAEGEGRRAITGDPRAVQRLRAISESDALETLRQAAAAILLNLEANPAIRRVEAESGEAGAPGGGGASSAAGAKREEAALLRTEPLGSGTSRSGKRRSARITEAQGHKRRR